MVKNFEIHANRRASYFDTINNRQLVSFARKSLYTGKNNKKDQDLESSDSSYDQDSAFLCRKCCLCCCCLIIFFLSMTVSMLTSIGNIIPVNIPDNGIFCKTEFIQTQHLFNKTILESILWNAQIINQELTNNTLLNNSQLYFILNEFGFVTEYPSNSALTQTEILCNAKTNFTNNAKDISSKLANGTYHWFLSLSEFLSSDEIYNPQSNKCCAYSTSSMENIVQCVTIDNC